MDRLSGAEFELAARIFSLIFGFGPVALVILCGLLVPGRKGKMRTQREAVFQSIDPASLHHMLMARLARFGFATCAGQVPGQLRASRPKRTLGHGPGEIHTHASKPLEMEIRVEASTASTFRVVATAWTHDLVFLDTGEGSHIDQCLEYLLQGVEDPLPELPAPIPNLTMKASTSLAAGILLAIAAPVQLLPWFTPPRTVGFMVGIATGTAVGVTLGGLGLLDTIRRPHDMRGRKVALAGILLSLVGLALVLALFFPLHGAEALAWLRERPAVLSPR